MAIFTHFDFQELTNNENNLNHQLHQEKKEVQHSPSKTSVQNILVFSKALSIRKSDNLGHIDSVLN